MKVLKETDEYLERQIRFYRRKAYFILIASIIGLGLSIFYTVFSRFPIFYLGLLFCLFGLIIAGDSYGKSSSFKRGLEAEKLVTKHLQDLDDNYILINDLKLPDSYGNIDHVLLGSTGIFAIETKDFEGRIRCRGDDWYQYKYQWVIPQEYAIRSPSKQAKRNALSLKQIIETESNLDLWVDAILVFTNSNIELVMNNPTITALKICDLSDYIRNKKTNTPISHEKLETIGKSLMESLNRKGVNTALCPSCGHENPHESIFCGNCGRKI